MDNTESSPQPADNKPEESGHIDISKVAKRAARLLGAGGAVTTALVLGSNNPNRSPQREASSNVPYETIRQPGMFSVWYRGYIEITNPNPSRNGEKGLPMGPEQVALIKNPVMRITDENPYIVGTLDSGSSNVTNKENVYTYSLNKAEEQASFYAPSEFYNEALDRAALPVGEAAVGSDGSFHSGPVAANQLSRIEILSRADAQKKLEQLGLVQAVPPSPH